MAGKGYRLKINKRNIKAETSPGHQIDIHTKKFADKVKKEAQSIIRAEGRVDTGQLLASLNVSRSTAGSYRSSYSVGSSSPYARFQEEGVQGPIGPKSAQVLAFKPKGATAYIFRPQASGFEGIHFLQKGAQNALRTL